MPRMHIVRDMELIAWDMQRVDHEQADSNPYIHMKWTTQTVGYITLRNYNSTHTKILLPPVQWTLYEG